MKADKTILAIVPARGGSKGIKLKNLLKLNGKSLVAHVADAVKRCDFIDETVVSTDNDLIREEAMQKGLKAPFKRPEEISGDRISDIQVLAHALTESEKFFKRRFDIVLMLQPTSPLRSPDHITACVDHLIKGGFDSCITVSETDSKYHPLKALTIEEDSLSYYDAEGEYVVARQTLKPVFFRNGICYAFTRDCILKKGRIVTDYSSAVITEGFVVDIDSMDDVRLAELYFRGLL